MKKFIFSAMFAALCISQASAHLPIKAKRASSHVGQQITVVDSVYSVKYYNDSTAVIELGGKGNKTPLNVVFKLSHNAKLDAQFLNNCKQAKLSVTGNVVSVIDQPTMVVTNKNNVHFLLASTNSKWLTFAQVSKRKN